MLDIAREKLASAMPPCTFLLAGSEELPPSDNSYDLVTAIMSHHYLPPEDRRQATENCFQLLRPGGLYVTFETIRPTTEKSLAIGLDRWRRAQESAGKAPDVAAKHLSRYGVELLPITLNAHLDLLRDTGFSIVEVFWTSYLQAGFYAIK